MLDLTLICLPKPHLKDPFSQINLGVAYIAGSVRNRGFNVDIVNFGNETDEEAVLKLENSMLFGISVTAMEVLHANRFSKLIKERFPYSFVFVGGPGTLSKRNIDIKHIDSIFFGEAEITIFDVIRDAKNRCLKPIYYGETIQDIDSLDFFPARDLYKNKQGSKIFAGDSGNEQSTLIVSSRGCVGKCHFCSSPALSDSCMRFRSPEKVAEEIIHIKEDFGITRFKFADDMFSCSPKRVRDICKALKPLNIEFRISARVKPFTDEMAENLINAGCKEIGFGVESADNNVLKGFNKNATVEDNRKALFTAHRHGITVRSLFMIRTPYQTKETIKKNKEFFLNTPIGITTCTSFVPLPGSEFYEHPEKHNIELLNFSLDDLNFYFFGHDGRNPLKPIFKIKDRPLQDFMEESEEFRDWIENDFKKVNHG